MKEKLRIGIIGCGTIGGYLLDAVLAGEVENIRAPHRQYGRVKASQGSQAAITSGIVRVQESRFQLRDQPSGPRPVGDVAPLRWKGRMMAKDPGI